ncbi:S8 family serine peptidase [bacterium]|nr:S8 family serine peptidase [bacterium]MBU1064009.1 S8 family serine peptidase [bacterium]MBU1634382.1 S8 family serine peptidase [bacterium]MBU1875243.1 S8 family serine peptidase [bacterium]
MKKLRLLNLSGSIAGTFLILMWMLGGGTALTQTFNDLDREILVYIQPSILEFPAGERDAVLVERLTIKSLPLHQVFSQFNIDRLVKAFTDFSETDTIRTSEDGRLVSVPRFSRIFRIQVSDKSKIDSVIAALSRVPGILFAEKNMDAKLFADPTYTNQWHLNNTGQGGGTSGVDINAVPGWDVTTGSSSIIVAVVDGGVESHEDFHTVQLIPGYTARTGGDGSPAPGNTNWARHGQCVAGISAAAFNTFGVRGVTDNVKIMPIRIGDAGASFSDIAAAIDTAWTRGAPD